METITFHPLLAGIRMGFLGLIVVLAVIAGLLMLVGKLKARGIVLLMLLLGGGFLMMLMSYKNATTSTESIMVIGTLPINTEAAPSRHSESFDTLVEMFNRNLIPLDREATKITVKSKAVKPEDVKPEESANTEADVREASKEKQPDEKRPDWVDRSPKCIGNVYHVVVSTASHNNLSGCYQDIASKLHAAVLERIRQLTGENHVPQLNRLGLTTNYILSEICNQRWVEVHQVSVGDFKRLHILMEFNSVIDNRLRKAYRDYQRGFRIEILAAATLGVIGILALIYGLLQFDTYTRGYYTKRLFFGVPAAIIAVVLLIA